MNDQSKCPKCGQIDMVQKVSALYTGGIATGEYSGPSVGVATSVGSGRPALVTGSTRLSGVSQTALSAELAPPAKPTYKPPGGRWLIWVLAICVVAGFADAAEGVASLMTIIVTLVCLVTTIFFILWWRKQEGSKRRKKFEQEMDVWKKVIGKWDQLYYCARDDGVFIPGQTRLVPVGHMRTLLYK